jgi:uncharacterized sulfatase
MKLLIFVAVTFLGNFFTQSAPLQGSRPNIIFILADDLGKGDLACLGNPDVETPNLDSLYAKSTRLTDFHVSPTCSPTRAALMTGLHEFKVGVTHTIEPRYNLLKTERTIAEELRAQGYSAGLFCKWHLGEKPEFEPSARGFQYVALLAGKHGEHYFNPEYIINGKRTRQEGYFSDVTFNLAEQWIVDQVKAGQPFFAWIADKSPHEPYVAPDVEAEVYLKKGFSKEAAHRFGMIHNLDANVGRLLDDCVNLMDIAPTFLEVGGLKPPEVMTGRSFLNVLQSEKAGQVDPNRTWVVTGRERHVADAREDNLPYPQRALRTPEFLYIRNFAPDRWPMGSPKFTNQQDLPSVDQLETQNAIAFADMDLSPTKAWLVRQFGNANWKWHYDYAFGKRPAEELFDLRQDPHQTNNLAADPAYAKQKEELSARLMTILTDAKDPRVLEGGKAFENPPFTDVPAEIQERRKAAPIPKAGTT